MIIIIALIVAILVMSLLVFKRNIMEGFTSDEAIQNVASLYNTGTLTASNLIGTQSLKVTGPSTLKGITAENVTATAVTAPTITGSTSMTSPTITGTTQLSSPLAALDRISPKTANGLTTIDNLAATKMAFNPVIVSVTTWSNQGMIDAVKAKGIMKTSMPDGTIVPFWCHASANKFGTSPNPHYYHKLLWCMKYGNNFYITFSGESWSSVI